MSAGAFERLLPWIRAQFPQIESLRDGTRRIYLDNAAGTLVPRSVSEAMAEAAIWANPQPDRYWPDSPRTKREHRRTRELLADFLNAGEGDRIYLAESTTAALYKLREALEPCLGAGDNVVVTDCDHFANITPWEWRARWEVRRAPMLPDGHLDLDRFAALLDHRTRVAALTVASNGLGTVLRAAEAVRIARERAPEAVVVLDAVHAAPHLPLDAAELGADALAFSAYKLFGPVCGVLWLRRELLPRLDPYRVEPHLDAETLMEWGTLSSVNAAGVRAALEYVQRLGERLEPAYVGSLAGYPRGRRLFKVALTAVREYEAGLSRRVLCGLAELPGVTVFGVTEPARAEERVPTFAFSLEGVPDEELEARLWEAAGLQVAAGTHYSAAVLRGLNRKAAPRASFAHYNTPEEADAFVAALRPSMR
jgi:cysteine desulfurase family protein (TIGR01976 family)